MAKHLSYDDRLDIEKYLKENYSISEISRQLNRHKSTISREITLRSSTHQKGCYGRSYNACIYRFDCDMKNICSFGKCNNKRVSGCRFCDKCNDNCQYFKEDICTKLTTSPYVCNGCEDRNKCTLTKKIYSAKFAQKDYEGLLVESRIGIEISSEELKKINDIITPLVNNGQSIRQIHSNNRDTIMVSEELYTNILTIRFYLLEVLIYLEKSGIDQEEEYKWDIRLIQNA